MFQDFRGVFKFELVSKTTVLLIMALFAVAQADGNGACHSLSAQSNSSDTNILCAGLVPSSGLLLITKDFYVFQLAHGALNSKDTIYMESSPMLIKDKWPTLYKNERFQEISTGDHIYNSFTVASADSEYLFFTTKKEQLNKRGVTYDITKDVASLGLTYQKSDDQVLISSSEQLLLYAINNEGGLQIAKYRFDSDDIANSNISQEGEWQKMCASDSGDEATIYLSPSACPKPINWAVLRGFIDKSQFFLFAPTYIYIFDLDVVQSVGKKGTVTKKQYDGFFVCGIDWGMWIILIVIILVILLLLLALIYFCCCNKKKSKDEPKANKKKSSKKSKSTKPVSFFGAQVTNRSKFDKKSKKNKSSKSKSKSKKGSNKSAMASKFTSGNNQATGRSAFK